jgi:hypothetical protein
MAYEQNPLPYEVQSVLQTSSPDEIDETIRQLSSTQPEEEEAPVELQEDGNGMALDIQGQTPELGSQLANMEGLM